MFGCGDCGRGIAFSSMFPEKAGPSSLRLETLRSKREASMGKVLFGSTALVAAGAMAATSAVAAQDGLAWDAGATYSTGPWTVGATYFHSEVEGAPGGGDSELSSAQGDIAYAVGPGITASANALWADWDGQGGVDANGFGGVVGMHIGF
jgi:predicted porin